MDERVYYLVFIYLKPGKTAVFYTYETQAATIMADHGGRFELVLQPDELVGDVPMPDEVHLLSFASEDGFAGYRQDARSQALAAMREESVAAAVFLSGHRLPNYGVTKSSMNGDTDDTDF